MNIEFEYIVPWNGIKDTGKDVRLKLERNFKKVISAFDELEKKWDRYFEEKKDPNGIAYLFTNMPIVTAAGITMYSGENVLVPSIFEGIPLNKDTLAWVDGKITVVGGTGAGGSVDGIILNDTTYSPNGDTKLITLPDLVTIDSQQLITGEKTFTNRTVINHQLSIGAVLPSYDWNRAELDVIGIGSYPSDLWLGADGKRMFAITARPTSDGDNSRGINFYDDANSTDFLKYNPANMLLNVRGKNTHVFNIYGMHPSGTYMQITGVSGKTAEFGSYTNLDAYMQAPFLPGAPTLLLKSDGTNSVNFGFNNVHYPLWHDGNISRNINSIFQGGWKTLDLTSYDQNTWYPCSTALINTSYATTPCRIVIYDALDSRSHPSWATHAQGFTLMLDMETYANGWGTIAVNTYLNNYWAGYGGETAFGGTEQNDMGSTCILWLRGGAVYKYWTNYDGNIYGNKDGYSWVNGVYSFSRSPRSTQGSPLTGFDIMRDRSSLCTLGRHTIRVNDSYDIGIGNNSGYLEVQSAGSEIIMTSGSSDMHVNYRGSSVGAGVPSNWFWHQGAPGNWANFYIGNLIINGYNENPVIINTSNPNESSIAYKIQNNLTFIAGSSTNNFFIWAPGKGDLFKAFNDGRVEFNGGSIYLDNDGLFSYNWLRTIGNYGWHNQTHGGGINMTDSTYVRVTNGKWFRVDGKISCGEYQDDAYGYMNVTRPAGDSYCCYAFVRNGIQPFGIGYNLYNEIVIGIPNGSGLWNHQILRINGNETTVSGNFLATGGVTMYSQRNLKNIIGEADFSLRELASIKPTYFTWKDKRDERKHIGGIAEDVQKLFPEVIYKTSEDMLTMDYGNAAFAISTVLAQHTLRHETEIEKLKKENEQMKKRIEELERRAA